jgi:hypothetical protein
VNESTLSNEELEKFIRYTEHRDEGEYTKKFENKRFFACPLIMKMNPNAGGEEASSNKVGHEHGVLTLDERLGEIPRNRVENTSDDEPCSGVCLFESGLICNPGNGKKGKKTDDEGENGGKHRGYIAGTFLF